MLEYLKLILHNKCLLRVKRSKIKFPKPDFNLHKFELFRNTILYIRRYRDCIFVHYRRLLFIENLNTLTAILSPEWRTRISYNSVYKSHIKCYNYEIIRRINVIRKFKKYIQKPIFKPLQSLATEFNPKYNPSYVKSYRGIDNIPNVNNDIIDLNKILDILYARIMEMMNCDMEMMNCYIKNIIEKSILNIKLSKSSCEIFIELTLIIQEQLLNKLI